MMHPIQTKRLLLRAWETSDIENLYLYAKDPRVGPRCGWKPHESPDESREVLHQILQREESYAIALLEDNRAIGGIGLNFGKDSILVQGEDEAEIGYWIGVPFWGQGLTPEAVRALLSHAFLECGCTRVWCGYFDGNDQSRRAQEKCGFVYSHTLPMRDVPQLHAKRTEHVTYLTREAWQALAGKT